MSLYTDRRLWCERRGSKYVTISEVPWEIGRKGSGLWLCVSPLFVFEPSIPLLARPVINTHDPHYLGASCLHDYALHILEWDRGVAGGIFWDALRADGVGRLRATVMAAVTMYGPSLPAS